MAEDLSFDMQQLREAAAALSISIDTAVLSTLQTAVDSAAGSWKQLGATLQRLIALASETAGLGPVMASPPAGAAARRNASLEACIILCAAMFRSKVMDAGGSCTPPGAGAMIHHASLTSLHPPAPLLASPTHARLPGPQTMIR